MKMFLSGAVVSAAILSAAPAVAQVPRILGGGNASCQRLIDGDRFYVEQANMQWLIGFMNGISGASYANSRITGIPSPFVANLDRLTVDQIVARAESYCRANPSRTLFQAAQRIVVDLS